MSGQCLYTLQGRRGPALPGVHVVAESPKADFWYVVWTGAPPAKRAAHPRVAPVVWVGTALGRPVYLERVPAGTACSALDLEPTLSVYVAAEVRQILTDLRAAGKVDGPISADSVWISTQGEVCLTGLGRTTDPASLSPLRMQGLLLALADIPVTNDPAGEAASISLAGSDGVKSTLLGRLTVAATAGATLGPPVAFAIRAEAVDEVVPDIGPDATQDGLLDRWQGTTGGRSGETAGRLEVTDSAPSVTTALSISWTSPPEDTTGAAPFQFLAARMFESFQPSSATHEEVTAVEHLRSAEGSAVFFSSWRLLEFLAAMGIGAFLMWLWTGWSGW